MATQATPANSRGSTGVLALRGDDLVWNEVDGQIVVLDTRTSTYHAVSGAGVTLWPLLAGGTTREELVDRLLAVFTVDRATADADVEEFLAEAAPLLRR